MQKVKLGTSLGCLGRSYVLKTPVCLFLSEFSSQSHSETYYMHASVMVSSGWARPSKGGKDRVLA